MCVRLPNLKSLLCVLLFFSALPRGAVAITVQSVIRALSECHTVPELTNRILTLRPLDVGLNVEEGAIQFITHKFDPVAFGLTHTNIGPLFTAMAASGDFELDATVAKLLVAKATDERQAINLFVHVMKKAPYTGPYPNKDVDEKLAAIAMQHVGGVELAPSADAALLRLFGFYRSAVLESKWENEILIKTARVLVSLPLNAEQGGDALALLGAVHDRLRAANSNPHPSIQGAMNRIERDMAKLSANFGLQQSQCVMLPLTSRLIALFTTPR